MKTKNLLIGLLVAATLFVVVDVSAMQRAGTVAFDNYCGEQAVVSPQGSERSAKVGEKRKRSQSPAVDGEGRVEVKQEPEHDGEQIARVVLPGGENRDSAIDVDKLNADIVEIRKHSDVLKRQLAAAKGLGTKRANEMKELKDEQAALTEEMNKKIAALAKSLKQAKKDNKDLKGQVVALSATIQTLKETCDAMNKRLDALEAEEAEDAEEVKPAPAVSQEPTSSSWAFWRKRSQPAAK